MKKALAILLVLVMALTLVACGKDLQADGVEKGFTVEVTHRDGTSKVFEYVSDQPYLGPVLLEAGLIAGKQDQYGLVISAVDGETAVYETDGAYWALFVGEEYALQGIDTTPITEGGVYKLVYTKA